MAVLWPKTSFVRGLEEIAALKHQPGKAIYLVGVSNYGEPYRCRAGG